MTTLNLADIPDQINTLERLAMWAILALRRVNPTQQVLEIPGGDPERVAQAAVIQADDDTIRFFGRVSIPLDSSFAEDKTTKLWIKAEELSNVVLPDAYKQN